MTSPISGHLVTPRANDRSYEDGCACGRDRASECAPGGRCILKRSREGFPFQPTAIGRFSICRHWARTIQSKWNLGLHFIGSGDFPLHLMTKHRFGRAEVDLAVRSVGGQGTPEAVHVTVLLWS